VSKEEIFLVVLGGWVLLNVGVVILRTGRRK
jgi:hypothetical protein